MFSKKILYTKNKTTKLQIILCAYIIFVFVQSLFYKFTDSAETLYIFSTLDNWAAGFYKAGLFNAGGIFSAKVIGSFELIASSLLLASLITKLSLLRLLGALLGICIMSGAIFFHLFTPLGTVVFDDGGTLFAMACGVWISSATLIYSERNFLKTLLN
jgi:hypothetical protein